MKELQHNAAAVRSIQNSLDTLRGSRKFHTFVVVLFLGVLGYLVGPMDLPPGDYTAEINVSLPGQSLLMTYPFKLDPEAGRPVTETQKAGVYTLVLEAQDAYRYGLGQSIHYRLQLLDAASRPVHLALDNVQSTGGVGSAIGTPANIIAISFLNDFADTQLGFVDWFYYGLPVLILLVPIIWLYLILVFRVKFHHVGPHAPSYCAIPVSLCRPLLLILLPPTRS